MYLCHKQQHMQPRHYLFIASIFLLSVIYIGAYRINRLSELVTKKDAIIGSIQDTLRQTEKDKRIAIIQGLSVKDLKRIQTQDSMMLQLQAAVSSYENELKKIGSSVVALETATGIISKTPTIIKETEIIKDPNVKYIYPTYTAKSGDKWHSISTVATRDSIYNDISFKDKYNVVLGHEKKGLFKTEPTAMIQSLSPYSEVKDSKAMRVTGSTQPKISLGGHVGFGGQYGLIHKNVDFGPQAGVSVNIKF